MKKCLLLLSVLALLLIGDIGLAAKKEVSVDSIGFASKKYHLGGSVYFVDTIAHICFFSSVVGTTVVPCSKLKNRPEFSSVITWND